MAKRKTSVNLSRKAADLLEQLAAELGVNQSAVMEIAIRDLAKKELNPGDST